MHLDDILSNLDKNLDDMCKFAQGFLRIHAQKTTGDEIKKSKKPSIFITIHSLHGVNIVSKINNISAHDDMLHAKLENDIAMMSHEVMANLLCLREYLEKFPIFSNQDVPHVCLALINKGCSGYRRKIDFQVSQNPGEIGKNFKSYLPYEHESLKAIFRSAQSLLPNQATLSPSETLIPYRLCMEHPQINPTTIFADSPQSALAFCAIAKCARLACPQSRFALGIMGNWVNSLSKQMFEIS